eukprot:547235_1
MADVIGSDNSLLGSTASGFTYGRQKDPRKRKGLLIALCVITILIGGILAIIYVAGESTSTPSPPPPETYLIRGSHIFVDMVKRISRFRSAAGGSWPGINDFFNHNKTCGSFKHWFEPYSNINASDIQIFSPLQGRISRVTVSYGTDDAYGYDIQIQGSPIQGDAEYIVTIGHVNITDHAAIQKDKLVQLGTPLGHHIGHFVYSDISILNMSAFGEEGEYISMFNVMDYNTLDQFQRWNITNRTYPIISDPERKIYPLNCTGNNQIQNNSNYYILPNWMYLNTSPPTPAPDIKKKK